MFKTIRQSNFKLKILATVTFGLILTFLLSSMTCYADNPVVATNYTADPTARVFDGTLYLYPSTDLNTNEDVYVMDYYHVYSTTDLVNWTDHGVVLEEASVPWVAQGYKSMWAPDCIEKNGTYYFYFGSMEATTYQWKIGVATSSSPAGPFTAEATPIQGVDGMDANCFIDDDGTPYLLWLPYGGDYLKIAELKPNMKELASPPVTIPRNQFCCGTYFEGPWVYKHDGKYYLQYAETVGVGESLSYSIADNIMGPYTYKGVIMQPNSTEYTIQCSTVEYNGIPLFFYHNEIMSGELKKRSVCVEYLEYNADGSIKPIAQTKRGVGIPYAGDQIQVDRYSDISNASVEYVANSYPIEWSVAGIMNNSWVQYNNVDFGTASPTGFKVRASSATSGGTIEVREDSPQGQLLGTVTVTNTGGWQDWATFSADLSSSITGIKNIALCFSGGSGYLMNVDSIQFTYGSPAYYKIINRYSSKAFSLAGTSTNDGVNIFQWSDNEYDTQKWQLVNVGGGCYAIINKYSGKSAEVLNASTDDGANVQQRSYNGSENQKWELVDVDGSCFAIINKWSGKALEDYYWSTADGGNIDQWTYVNQMNEQWFIIPVQ